MWPSVCHDNHEEFTHVTASPLGRRPSCPAAPAPHGHTGGCATRDSSGKAELLTERAFQYRRVLKPRAADAPGDPPLALNSGEVSLCLFFFLYKSKSRQSPLLVERVAGRVFTSVAPCAFPPPRSPAGPLLILLHLTCFPNVRVVSSQSAEGK